MTLSSYFSATEGGDTTFTVDPPRIKFGVGALAEIGHDARALAMTRVGLFCDSRVVRLEPVSEAAVTAGR